MKNNNIKCICFDFGGILVETRSSWNDITNYLRWTEENTADEEYQLEKSSWRKEYDRGEMLDDSFLNKASTVYQLDKMRIFDAHMAILTKQIPDVENIIIKLKEQGFMTTGLSNTNQLHWNDLKNKEKYPAISLLDKIVLSFECGLTKPDPKIYSYAENKFGFLPDEILFFDDLIENIDGAENSGWNACWIDSSKNVSNQIKNYLSNYNIFIN